MEHEHDTHFEQADAGSSTTYPQQAGTIRKNGFIAIKGRPCKVVDVSTSKTGKHGHAKCHFVGLDLFTSKKYEELVPSSHNCEVPNISREEYSLLDINDEGYVTLMTTGGDTREDLVLPKDTEDDQKLTQNIKADFGEQKEILVSIVKAMGEEKIVQYKTVSN